MLDTHYLFDKKYTCPICENYFTSKTFKTSSKKVVKQDSDFFKYYNSEDNPYYYEIIICPKCGYASSASCFDNISDKQKEIIEEKITNNWTEKNFGTIRSFDSALSCFKLALHEASLINTSNTKIAILCLKIAWLYRIKEEVEKESEFLQNALNYLQKAYSFDYFPEDNLNLFDCTYLIGELYRRLENFSEAIKWFNITLKTKGVSTKIEKLTRDQWYLTREEYKKKGSVS